jgi:hypothetical protein
VFQVGVNGLVKLLELIEVDKMLDKIKKKMVTLVLLVLIGAMVSCMFCNVPEVAAQSGYSSAFEGPKARFYGIEWDRPATTIFGVSTGGGGTIRFSQTDLHSGTSLSQFDTVLRFDPDSASTGFPNLFGEQTSVFIPRESLGSIPSWLPSNWINTMSYIQNPQASYNWTVGDKTYSMQQWLLRYYVSLSAEWNGNIDILGGHGEIPPAQSGITENSFQDLDLWIEFDVEPSWYIQGQGTAYFAIGKVQLADSAQYQAKDVNGNMGNARTEVSVSPESQAALAYLYYEPWAVGAAQNHEASYYQGKQLNPAYFTDKVYMRFSLNNFGVYSGNQLLGIGYWVKGDTVKLAFDMTVFVVGEWSVQDIQNNPDDFGRFQRTGASSDWLTWLFSAETLTWLIPVAIFVGLLLFAPWILVLIVSIFRGR